MLLKRLRNAAQALRYTSRPEIKWCKRGGWLSDNLEIPLPRAPRKVKIEDRAWLTERAGALQVDSRVYDDASISRSSDEVRSALWAGDLYAHLAQRKRPKVVIEFGSAFGVSGMYWIAGLEAAGTGHLYSFEVNPKWAEIAGNNMRAIGNRFTLTVGVFEEQVDSVIGGKPIDIAFVDGVHKGDFIKAQWEIIKARLAPGAVVLFDDIDFATGGMYEGWQDIWQSAGVVAACELRGHTGVVEWEGPSASAAK